MDLSSSQPGAVERIDEDYPAGVVEAEIGISDEDWGAAPPPPEEPPDWLDLPTARTPTEAAMEAPGLFRIPEHAVFEPAQKPEMESAQEPAVQPMPSVETRLTPAAPSPAQHIPAIAASHGRSPNSSSPYLTSLAQESPDHSGVRMITVLLRSSGDKARDVLRLRRIHGVMMTYPGMDRFSIHVFENGRGFLLEFPNSTTLVCPELIDRLNQMMGAENIRVEPVTFH